MSLSNDVSANEYFDVVILGAGAAGLFCAFTAAQRGRSVLVLEKSNKVGKKILMSGGGRCNFTNYFVEADHFISNNPHFCKAALTRYTQWDFINMVERHGIEYEERKHSQLFCKHSAKDILAMLVKECDDAGVTIRTRCDIDAIITTPTTISTSDEKTHRYKITLAEKNKPCTLTSQSLVVATGALSVPTLGGSGFGYSLAEQFGLAIIPRRAGLVPFMFSDKLKDLCERLAGLAVDVELVCNGRHFRENILFTHRGLSGPAILQISNYWSPGDEVIINLLPDIDTSTWLIEQKQQQGRMRVKTLLQSVLANKLVSELMNDFIEDEKRLADIPDKDFALLAKKINHWLVKPSATEGYRTAEVTLGGIDTDEISSKTMEAKKQAGLFFIGEVLDVTGHLGGFNFQWAWASAYSAGIEV